MVRVGYCSYLSGSGKREERKIRFPVNAQNNLDTPQKFGEVGGLEGSRYFETVNTRRWPGCFCHVSQCHGAVALAPFGLLGTDVTCDSQLSETLFSWHDSPSPGWVHMCS